MRLGVVVGLAAEGRIARPLGPVAIGGGLPAGAEAAAERLVAQGVTGLLSFGLAGGLAPGLRPGALVVPAAVLEAGTRFVTDTALTLALGGVTANLILAEPGIVVTAAAKQALAGATGAVAVDLESGAVARVAARHGLPFAVLRAICDPAERSLPPAALVAIGAQGAIGLLRVAAAVLRRPAQLPALIALAGDAARARGTLLRVVRSVSGDPPVQPVQRQGQRIERRRA